MMAEQFRARPGQEHIAALPPEERIKSEKVGANDEAAAALVIGGGEIAVIGLRDIIAPTGGERRWCDGATVAVDRGTPDNRGAILVIRLRDRSAFARSPERGKITAD